MTTESTPTQFGPSAPHSELTHEFGLNQKQFGSLADGAELKALAEHQAIIPVSIEHEINVLQELEASGHEGYLSITIPVVGMADFMRSEATWMDVPQTFGSVVSLNGYGAAKGEEGHARPDFVVVKDIIGNTYEVVVNPDGLIDIPQNGTGKFTVLSEITLMFGQDQILHGRGFEKVEGIGGANTMLLMPPPGFAGQFTPELRVSKTLGNLFEQEFSSRKVPIIIQHPDGDMPDFSVQSRLDTQSQSLSYDIIGQSKTLQPFKLQLTLDPLVGGKYSHEASAKGWVQESEGKYSKYYGMTEQGLHTVVKSLYSEFDFTKAIISGDHFGVKAQNGFNNFGLSPEAIGVYYDLWTDGLAKHYISGEELFSRISHDALQQLSIQDLNLSPHDAMVLTTILADARQGSFKSFADLFLSDSDLSQTPHFQDGLYLHNQGTALEHAPNANVFIQEFNLHGHDQHSYYSPISTDSMPQFLEAVETIGNEPVTLSHADAAHIIGVRDVLLSREADLFANHPDHANDLGISLLNSRTTETLSYDRYAYSVTEDHSVPLDFPHSNSF